MVRVVGVIEDHHHDGISEVKDPLIYLPLARAGFRRRFLVVRGAGAPATLIPEVRRAMAGVDPDLAVDFRPMSEVVEESTFPWTVGSAVLAVFGFVALLLAALGIYGVVGYAVADRRREFAIRMSLGADGGRMRRAAILETLRLSAVGIAVGFASALGVGRLAEAFLYGVPPSDPVALSGSVLVFVTVTALAAFLPAHRATAVAPAAALRVD